MAVHITQRGHNRADCFRRDSDHMVYLLHLRELSEKLACAVHAYCLMTNHVHLLLTPPTAEACTELMRNLGQRYVQYFNRTHGRTGTLWEGRYHSCVVESSRYVLACHRYIELNPVEAGMVPNPRAYAWSSYGANAGFGANRMLTPHPEYLALSEDPRHRGAAYRGLFEEAIEPFVFNQIRDATLSGHPLGSDSFRAAVELQLGRKVERGRPGRPSKSDQKRALTPISGKSGSDPDFQMPR
jgi:putative transposase